MVKILSTIIKRLIIIVDILFHRKKITKVLRKLKILKIKTIFDIGSNNCEYSLLFNKVFPKSKIFAFEPNPYLYKEAILKIKKNNKIKVIKKAVGNKNMTTSIKIDRDSPLTSTFAKINQKSNTYKIKKFLGQKKKPNKVNAKMIKLDKFINKKNKPDFIKIDVEGYEEEVLKGMRKNLKKTKLIMIEFHFDNQYKNYSTSRLHKYLITNKFKLFKSIKFPILNWEDRIYLNSNLSNFNH